MRGGGILLFAHVVPYGDGLMLRVNFYYPHRTLMRMMTGRHFQAPAQHHSHMPSSDVCTVTHVIMCHFYVLACHCICMKSSILHSKRPRLGA